MADGGAGGCCWRPVASWLCDAHGITARAPSQSSSVFVLTVMFSTRHCTPTFKYPVLQGAIPPSPPSPRPPINGHSAWRLGPSGDPFLATALLYIRACVRWSSLAMDSTSVEALLVYTSYYKSI